MIDFINRGRLYLGLLFTISNLCLAAPPPSIYTTTLSILSYAKWNTMTPKLCIIEPPFSTNQFIHLIKKDQLPYIIESIHKEDLEKKRCDAVFFDKLSAASEQELINSSLNTSILSFSANNAECEIGSVFCLYRNKNGNILFKVNLDSLSRSKIHIDPRVLLLAKNSE